MDRFSAAARNGFKGVEYLFPYDYPAEDIREQLDANGLKQVTVRFPCRRLGSRRSRYRSPNLIASESSKTVSEKRSNMLKSSGANA